MTDTTGTWLTQEAYDRLQAEYDHLVNVGRVEIAKEIDDRRQEGDLKENGGYHAAREEQAKQEARIEQLRHILRSATVGEASTDAGIQSGTVVVAEVMGREMKFLVGSREVAGGTDIDVFSAQSPLGAALMGKHPGDETTYTAPNGNEIPVKVISAEPFGG
ncbi:transcription elongation factor GreA [Demequina zhanjiangensis]|uniref:Transcription elongation factor GreA n=1 Tax=Demequina zhanjiangensis TaxID=3051659 RepID=A0ABT8G4L8_9MICO|nr:transcription elongation factor GreA [Demequina sp. SYSU T00b26]MDN4474088.1 transcription elongation factor GreA [Demequina sp. SYSU T00b26]